MVAYYNPVDRLEQRRCLHRRTTGLLERTALLVFLRDSRKNLRIVRKSWSALRALFPTVRGEILAATLTQPEKWWYLSELAQFLRTTPSSLQRDLKALVEGGILQKRREGTRTYFKAETRSPLFPDLRGLVEKTAGLLPTLQQVLKPFEARLDCAFVYGSVARGQEHALSDVDLLVIGAVGVAELAPALRKAEARLGRDVNVTRYSRPEFRKKVATDDHFLSEVLRAPKEFVKGDQRDLDEVIGKPRRSTPSDSGLLPRDVGRQGAVAPVIANTRGGRRAGQDREAPEHSGGQS